MGSKTDVVDGGGGGAGRDGSAGRDGGDGVSGGDAGKEASEGEGDGTECAGLRRSMETVISLFFLRMTKVLAERRRTRKGPS